MLVTDQKTVNGIPRTTLLFVEYGKNHSPLPPRIFTIAGNEVHLDAMVIKFERDFVKAKRWSPRTQHRVVHPHLWQPSKPG